VSIYSRLFRYRPRPLRTPHEDFLSAALVDLLNRLPREAAAAFVGDVLLKNTPGRRAWEQFVECRTALELRWVSQSRVKHQQSGVVDILLLVDGCEALVVENKIGAPVKKHQSVVSGKDGDLIDVSPMADATQLSTYGRWLAGRCDGRAWPGALVLLTHFTSAPPDFGLDTAHRYGVPFTRTCHWHEVWAWARRIGTQENPSPERRSTELWSDLCFEFADFLEEENMAADYMTLHDLAAAEVFVSGVDRIGHTFASVQKVLARAKEELGGRDFYGPAYSGNGGLIWDWFVLREASNKGWHLAWGIRFPEISKYWTNCEPPLPPRRHVFLVLASDGKPLPLAAIGPGDLPPGWRAIPGEGFVLACALHELRPDAEGFASDMANWVADGINSIKPVISKLVSAIG